MTTIAVNQAPKAPGDLSIIAQWRVFVQHDDGSATLIEFTGHDAERLAREHAAETSRRLEAK